MTDALIKRVRNYREYINNKLYDKAEWYYIKHVMPAIVNAENPNTILKELNYHMSNDTLTQTPFAPQPPKLGKYVTFNIPNADCLCPWTDGTQYHSCGKPTIENGKFKNHSPSDI